MTVASIFTWFYCLDYTQSLLLLLLMSLIYQVICESLPSQTVRKLLSWIFLICWINVILSATLFRPTAESHTPNLIPFHSYREALQTGNIELYRSNFMNAVLFYPIGLLMLYALQPPFKPMLPTFLLALFLSIGIEVLQYHFKLGQPEVDDILHNILGAILGVGIPGFTHQLITPIFPKGSS